MPVELKLIHGNPGKRAIPANTFRPPVRSPKCPRHLQGEARKEWRRLCKLLAHVVAEEDRGALAMICTTWARHVEAELTIAKMAAVGGGSGLFVKSLKGRIVQSPWVGVSNRAIELHSKLCSEFGLTPSSRNRVGTGVPSAPPGIRAPGEKKGWSQFTS